MDDYQQLAQLALAQCPPAFHEVRLSAELDDGYSRIDLRCRRGDEEIRVTGLPAETSFGIHLRLEAILEEMGRLSGQKWSRCKLQVLPDGTFKFDVEY